MTKTLLPSYNSIETREHPASTTPAREPARTNPAINSAEDFLEAYREQANHGPGLSYGHHHKSVAGSCQDADDETRSAVHIWPFAECRHRDWGYDKEKRYWCQKRRSFEAICCLDESDVHKSYKLAVALLHIVVTSPEEQNKYEDLAVALLRIAVGEVPKTASDCMFHAFALDWLGILLATRDFCKNEHEAVELFTLCSDTYKYPGAFYHYGYALLYGTGGVERNILEGIALLNQAGARRIAEAYFSLGSVYETGLSDGMNLIPKDVSKACDYYKAATGVYSNSRKFEYDIAALKDWFPDFADLMCMLPTTSWHTLENETSSLLGQRFNWCLVGQAFLFSAAASLANVSKFHHFQPLLGILPILGMLIAGFSIFHVSEVTLRYKRTGDPVNTMLQAKIKAYQKILDASENCHYNIYAAKLEGVRDHFKQYQQDVEHLRRFTKIYFHGAFLLIEHSFLCSWLVLVLYELSTL